MARSTTQLIIRSEIIQINTEDILISFDVKSLFTKIPIEFALSSLEKLLDDNQEWHQRTALDKEDVIELTKICLQSTMLGDETTKHQ